MRFEGEYLDFADLSRDELQAKLLELLTLVETSDGAPNGYVAPGIIFLSSGSIGTDVNQRLVASMVSRWCICPRDR